MRTDAAPSARGARRAAGGSGPGDLNGRSRPPIVKVGDSEVNVRQGIRVAARASCSTPARCCDPQIPARRCSGTTSPDTQLLAGLCPPARRKIEADPEQPRYILTETGNRLPVAGSGLGGRIPLRSTVYRSPHERSDMRDHTRWRVGPAAVPISLRSSGYAIAALSLWQPGAPVASPIPQGRLAVTEEPSRNTAALWRIHGVCGDTRRQEGGSARTTVIHGGRCLDRRRRVRGPGGPSGCGKSTLLRMIAGLENISAGEIRSADRIVHAAAPKQRDVAIVFRITRSIPT